MDHSISRRTVVRGLGALAALPMIGASRAQDGRPIRIGFVSPQTGPLAAMGEADKWTVESLQPVLSQGVTAGGKRHRIEVILKDSQSNPNRAGEVARDLILNDKVDLMLVSSTPETTNPVSDACELNGIPHISTMAPWQPWFFGRGGNPDKGFHWGYHFFWGIEDLVAVQMNMWKALNSNKKVGGLFPNDSDGNAAGDPDKGFKPALSAAGFTLNDPGRYQNMTQTFASHISAFKREQVELITGIVLPPDLKTFLTQARQQGLKLKAVSVGKAAMYPTSVEALGTLGEGVTCEVWWSPSHPFASSLTKQSAAALAKAWEDSTKRQWTQPLGFVHALFEVAFSALSRSGDPVNKAALRDAIARTDLATIVGPVKFGGPGPMKNISKTPLVGGQWVRGKTRPFDLLIVSNQTAPSIPLGGQIRSYN